MAINPEAPQRFFKGVWIHREIWFHPCLGWMEKLLLAEIDSLSCRETPCTASNLYLAGHFFVSERRMANMISQLKKDGWIDIKMVNRRREIRIPQSFWVDVCAPHPPSKDRVKESAVPNVDFTKSVNSLHEIRDVDFTKSVMSSAQPICTLEYSREYSKNKEVGSGLIEFPEALRTGRVLNRWGVWMNHRRGLKKPADWLVLFNEQIGWLSQFDEATVFEILSASIRNGWTGLFPLRAAAKAMVAPPYIQLRAIDDLISTHPANHRSTCYNSCHSAEQKAEYQSLKEKSERLTRQIASA